MAQVDRDKVKETIINLLFEVKKPIVTEVTIKYKVPCYNVNIQSIVREINSSGLYPNIDCVYNSYGVLCLQI
jgi:hypothetical protein